MSYLDKFRLIYLDPYMISSWTNREMQMCNMTQTALEHYRKPEYTHTQRFSFRKFHLGRNIENLKENKSQSKPSQQEVGIKKVPLTTASSVLTAVTPHCQKINRTMSSYNAHSQTLVQPIAGPQRWHVRTATDMYTASVSWLTSTWPQWWIRRFAPPSACRCMEAECCPSGIETLTYCIYHMILKINSHYLIMYLYYILIIIIIIIIHNQIFLVPVI